MADGLLRLTLRDVRGVPLPRWSSGAHIDVDCGTDADGEPLSRQYSLCGPGDADTYQIAVLAAADSRGGSRWIHARATAGATLRIRGPRNHFRLDPAAGRLLLIAGGIGITPVLAHADAAKAAGVDYHVHYAARSRAHLGFLDRLAADHAGRVTTYTADDGDRLRLTELLGRLPAGTQVYACGPRRMVEELEGLARDWPADALHVEHFSSTLGRLDPTQEHAFDVELRDSGLTLRVGADETVLQALRAANIDIPSDCEEGLCGSCEVAVLDGDIDHRDVVLTVGAARRKPHDDVLLAGTRQSIEPRSLTSRCGPRTAPGSPNQPADQAVERDGALPAGGQRPARAAHPAPPSRRRPVRRGADGRGGLHHRLNAALPPRHPHLRWSTPTPWQLPDQTLTSTAR